MRILLLNNNFYGSYISNQYFYSELIDACQELGVACTFVSRLEDAIAAIERQDISFSLCLGVFPYRLEGTPLYDLYNLPHYQWLSDNPLKFHLDHHSVNITYNLLSSFDKVTKRMLNEQRPQDNLGPY